MVGFLIKTSLALFRINHFEPRLYFNAWIIERAFKRIFLMRGPASIEELGGFKKGVSRSSRLHVISLQCKQLIQLQVVS